MELGRMLFAQVFDNKQIVATLWRQLSYYHFRVLLHIQRTGTNYE